MSRFWVKQIALHNVGGPHLIGWRPSEQSVRFPEEEGILLDYTVNSCWSQLLKIDDTRCLSGSVCPENPEGYTQHLISIYLIIGTSSLIPGQVRALLADLNFGFFLPPPMSSWPEKPECFLTTVLLYFGKIKIFTIPSNMPPAPIHLFCQTLSYL